MGHRGGSLLELGCSCKSDLALVHYACALKWFFNHGSTVCEICGYVAKSIKLADLKKVGSSLKDYKVSKKRTASGDHNPVQANTVSGVDPYSVAAIHSKRLHEISLWFNPNHDSSYVQAFQNNASASQPTSEQPFATGLEDNTLAENPASIRVVKAAGILVATAFLTIPLAWVVAPRAGKKTVLSGLYILLAGICALAVVVFFRFCVLTRIKIGPVQWVILLIFWFLMCGMLAL